MQIARVVGNVWATRKHPSLSGAKLLLVRSIDSASGKMAGPARLAVDKGFGSGPGDTVLLIDEGSSARQILKDAGAPIRLLICGIVDSVTVDKREARYH